MDYRYYIYKQNNLTIDFDKYDWSEYAYFAEIRCNSQWGLKPDRDRDWPQVIRRNFNGSISVSGLDYDTLIALTGEVKQYVIVIHQKCNGTYSEFWKGFFSYLDFKVDQDRCTLSFEPVVWDKYSAVYDQMPVERNVLEADTDHVVYLDAFSYSYEEVQESYIDTGITAASWIEYTGYAAGNLYYLYSRDIIFGNSSGGLNFYGYYDTYRRDYAITTDGVNPPDADPAWVLDPLLPGPGEYNLDLGQYKWVKPFQSLTAGTATYTHTVSGANNYYILDATATLNKYTLVGPKLLSKILEYFAVFFNLTYASNLLNDTPCPIGGPSMALTMVNQISNLRATGQQATKGMMSLKWLLTHLRDTFNAHWYIDADGDFRIEHQQYFENGLTYTPGPEVIELNLLATYPDRIKGLNRYEYSKPEFYRWERLEIQYSNSADWIDGNIEYKQYSIYGSESTTTTADWGTDINNMYAGREELPKTGWILLDVKLTGIIVSYYKVRNTVGAITGIAIQNGRFSSANILRDFWQYGRLLPMAWVNGVQTDFQSVKRLKKQVEVTIPQCCQDIDYLGLFRTGLGNGLIETAEYEAKTGILKMNLMYE